MKRILHINLFLFTICGYSKNTSTTRTLGFSRFIATAAFLMSLLFGTLSYGQTYYNMATGDYNETFTSWSTPATGVNWSSVATAAGTIPSATVMSVSSASFVSGAAGGLQNGTTNIQFLSTGPTNNTNSVAFDLNLNFSGRNAGFLSFNAASVFNSTGDRPSALKVYYSTNGTAWTELTATNLPFNAVNNVASSAVVNVALPAALNNQATVKLRFYNHNPGTGANGSRAKISLDNVVVTSNGTYTNTGATIVNGGVNFVGQPQNPTAYSQPTNCTAGDYRVLNYRKVSTTANNTTDGRGQWFTTILAQGAGGNVFSGSYPGGASNGFLFTSGGGCGAAGNYTDRWNFGGVGQAALNAVSGTTLNSTTDMGLNMSTAGYYSFSMKDVYNTNGPAFYVGYTTNPPVNIVSTTQIAVCSTSATVTATLSAAPSSQELFYLRFRATSNDFTASTSQVLGTVSGNIVTFNLTGLTNANTYFYYILSTTHPTYTSLSEVDKSLSCLKYLDNSGSNYSFTTATTSPTISAQPVSVAYALAGTSSNVATYSVTATNAATYQWQYATTVGGTYANVANATPTGVTYTGNTTTTLTVTTSSTTPNSGSYFYRCVVTSVCSTSVNSSSGQMVVYCLPTYSTGCTASDFINTFTLNALSSGATGCNNSTTAYSLGAQTTTLTQGVNYNATLTTGSGGGSNVNIWIDYNDNGVFETTERYVNTALIASSGTATIVVAVPSNATVGTHRMRVRHSWASSLAVVDPCAVLSWGETEDYNVTIALSCTQPTTQATIGAYTANTTGTSLTVNWTRGNGTAGVIVVARATATANQIPVGGTTYTPSTAGAFGGTTTTGTGNIVIFDGTGTSVNVTGLTAGVSYTFSVYEYNSASTCYLTPASASAITTCTLGTPSVSIAVTTGANPTCASTSITFTATPTNGGTPSYQWRLNGTNVGTNATTYTNATLVNGDQVSCIMTNAAACTTTVTSNTITMSVIAAPTTSNAGTGQSICVGVGSVTLAANAPTVGTGTWSVSGPSTLISQFSNVNSPTATFTPAGGAGSYVLTWSIANAPCTASTSTVTITASAAPSAIVISPTVPTVCSGNVVSLTPFPSSSTVAATAVAASSGTVTITGNPLRTFFGANRMQVIYTAAELTNAGLVSGSSMSGIAFNVTTATTETRTAFNIGYKYTSLSTFSGLTYETGIINVYSTALAATSTGTNTYNFATPSATWNGTDNVIFEFCFSDNVVGVNSSVVSALAATTGNTVIQAASDSTTTQCSLTTATTTGATRPFILLQSIKPSVVWSPTTELFTNAAATVAYTGAATTVVYAKPTGTRTYTATTSANGCSVSNTVVVTVATTPTVTGAIPSAVCNSGTVTLGATGSAGTILNWYAANTGGTSLATGTNFTTPSISTTTPYYVQADINNTAGIGVISESGSIGNFTIITGMFFSSANASTINSIDVYPGTAGTLNITMRDNTGTVIATQAFTIAAGEISTTVKKTLALTGFNVPAGSTGWTLNYDIGINRGASIYTFPYTFNGFSITGNGVNGNNISIGTRMYFYNWNVTTNSCSSARTLVNATVDPTPTTANAGPDQQVCSSNTITLAANTVTSGTGAWSIISGSGGTVTTPSSPTSTFTGTAGTTYTLRWTISSGVCTTSTDDVVITIFSPLDFVNVQFPGSATICQGNSLTAFGQVFEPGVTPGAGAQGPNITVEFGFNGTNTDPSTWTNWATASFNSGGGGVNNDEYQYVFTPSSAGTYYYAFRYKQGTCDTWQYGGFSGTGGGTWGGSNVSGVLTVNSNAAHTIALTSGSTTPALCQNTLLGTNIVYAIGGGATGAGITGLPSGMSGSFSLGTFTISGTPTASGTFNYTVTTTGNGCATAVTATGTITVSSTLDFVNLQFPASGTICQTGTFTAFGQVFESGVTPGAGQGSGITVEFGYNSTNNPPSSWSNWFTASYNSTVTGNNDEYQYLFTPPSSGTFYYAFRYKQGTCDWQYGGYTSGGGGTWGGSNVSGVLTVNPNVTPTFTAIAAICSGGSLSALPLTSNNSITGTWAPALDNTATTTYTFTPTAGLCATTATLAITVNPNVTPTFTAVAAICSGGSLSTLPTTSNNGVTGTWVPTLDNTATTTYTFTPTAGLCATTATLAITVNPNVTPTFTAVAAICSGGSLSTLPTTSNNSITGTWSPALDNTATTTYTFTPDAGQCATTATLTITVSNLNTWTGGANTTVWTTPGNWSCGLVPISTTDVIIGSASFYPEITSIVSINSLTLNSGTTLKVKSGSNLTVSDLINNNGTFTIENNANLIQVNAVSNSGSGSTLVKRNTNPLIRLDYTLWSSPVANQQLLAFSPLTSISPTIRFYTYNTSTNLYNSVASPSTTNFADGIGYLIRLPFNHPTAPVIWAGTFTGVANNGTKTITLNNIGVGQRFNAIGNPYPSTVNIAQFASDNSTKIEPSLYFWRKTNNTLSPSYCSWNTSSNTFVDNGETYTDSPLGILQTAQGFIVEAKAGATTIEFNNGQRTINNANQFFRTANGISATPPIESHRIWLNMTGATTEFSQMVVGYFTNAIIGQDDFDSKYFNDGPIALSSEINAIDYVIQGRPAPFNATDIVPLKYKVTNAGSYSIGLDHVDGLFTAGAQTVYLKDNVTNTYTDLNAGNYTFTSVAGTFNNRLELVYQNPLNNQNPIFNENNIVVYNQNNELFITSGNVIMKSVKIYDIRGRLLQEKSNINASETQLHIGTTNQVLILQITSNDDIKVVKKVIN